MLEQLLSQVPLSFHIFMVLATLTLLGAGGVAFSQNIVYAAFNNHKNGDFVHGNIFNNTRLPIAENNIIGSLFFPATLAINNRFDIYDYIFRFK